MWKDILINEFELNGKKYEIWEIAPFMFGRRFKVHMRDDNGIHTLYFNKSDLDYKNIETRFNNILKGVIL